MFKIANRFHARHQPRQFRCLPNAVTISRDWSRGCEGGGWPKWSPIVTKPLFFSPLPLELLGQRSLRHSTRIPPLHHLDDPIIRGRRWRLAIRQHWYANEIWRPCFRCTHAHASRFARWPPYGRIIIFLLSFNPWQPRFRAPPPGFDYFNGVTLSRKISGKIWPPDEEEESRNISFAEDYGEPWNLFGGRVSNQSLGEERIVLWRRIYWGKLDW